MEPMEPLGREASEAIDAFRRARDPDAGAEHRIWGSIRTELQANEQLKQRRRHRKRRVRRVMRVLRPISVAVLLAVSVGLLLHQRHVRRERAMLDRARMQLAVGEHMAGYRTLVEHSREFQSREAAERRMGLVVDALCKMDMPLRANEELERYLELNPSTAYADWVGRPCGTPLGPRRTAESWSAPIEPRAGVSPLPLEYGDHHVSGSEIPD